MAPIEDYLVEMGGGENVTVRFERADPGDPGVTRALLDIDLQTFTEATFSRHAARALLSHGAVYLLRHDGDILATAVCVRSWADPSQALLLSMGLLHGWRGRGLGKRFVGGIVGDLTSQGFDRLALHVAATNARALHVYRSLGFVEERKLVDPVDAGRTLLELRLELVAPATQVQVSQV